MNSIFYNGILKVIYDSRMFQHKTRAVSKNMGKEIGFRINTFFVFLVVGTLSTCIVLLVYSLLFELFVVLFTGLY